MNKFVAFVLGLVLGGVFLLGAIGMALYAGVVMIHPSDLVPEAGNYAGDLADMSIYDIYVEVSELVKSKLGSAEGGRYYTIGEFCDTYNIDTTKSFGVTLSADVRDIPLFEFFSKEPNEDGENGFVRALKQIKISAVPSIVNMFGGVDEEGNPKEVVSADAIAKLSAYSVYDAFMDEEKGLVYCFSDVQFAEVLPSFFPTDETTDNKLMYYVGKMPIGKLLSSMSGDQNLFAQLAPGGALEDIGSMKFTDLLGEGSETITSIFGDKTISSLIDGEGNVNPDGLLAEIRLGQLLKLTYDEDNDAWVDGEGNAASGIFAAVANWTIADVTNPETINSVELGGLLGYVKNQIAVDGTFTSAQVLATTTGEAKYILRKSPAGVIALAKASDAEASVEEWYEGQLDCEEPDHAHNADCYSYVWYAAACANAEHTTNALHQEAGETLLSDGKYHAKASGIFAALTGITIGDITGGGASDLMAQFADIKIGSLLEGTGIEVSEFMQAFADMTIADLMGEGLYTVRFGNLLGYKLNQITDLAAFGTQVPLYKSATATEPLLYVRRHTAAASTVCVLSADGETWHEGVLTCPTEGCAHGIASCYGYVWYAKCGNATHETCQNEILIDGVQYIPAQGIQNILANCTLESVNDVSGIINSVTIADVLTDVPAMLKSLADVPLGQLASELPNVHVGSLLGYERREVTAVSTVYTQIIIDGKVMATSPDLAAAKIAIIDDGKLWEGEFVCAKAIGTEHTAHDESCFECVWYKNCGESCTVSHVHLTDATFSTTNYYAAVSGIEKVLAGKRVSDLSNMNDIISQDITLGSVMGDSIPPMLASLADVTISGLSEAINDIYLGGVLGFARRDVDGTALPTEVVTGKVRTDGAQYAMIDGKTWYEAELTCAGTHAHSASCFAYVWYAKCTKSGHEGGAVHTTDGNDCHQVAIGGAIDYYYVAGDITGKLAKETIGNLGNMNETLKTVTLYDVLGDAVPDILKSIQNEEIGTISTAIDKLYLGDFLTFERNYLKSTSAYTVTLIDGVAIKNPSTGAIAVANNDGWCEGKLICEETSTTHAHVADCYGYVWYEICKTDHAHTSACGKAINVAKAGGSTAVAYGKVADGITGKLANQKVGSLGANLNDVITSFTLGEVLGDSIPSMLASLADVKIADVGSAIDGMYVGEMLSARRNDTCNPTTAIIFGEVMNATCRNASGIQITTVVKKDGDTWYEAKLTCDSSHTHVAACYDYVWYEKCEKTSHASCPESELMIGGVRFNPISGVLSSLSTLTVGSMNSEAITGVIDDLKLSDVLTIDSSSPKLLQKFADEKISNLGSAFDNVLLGDVMDTTAAGTNGLIAELAGVKVSEIGTAVNDVQLGSALNYHKVVATPSGATQVTGNVYKAGGKYYILDGGKYFEAELTCDNTHTHTAACYACVWYDGSDVKVSGVTKAIVNLTLNDMSNSSTLKNAINGLKLNDIVTAGDNKVLQSIGDAKVSELGDKLNKLQMGEVFGYYKMADGNWYKDAAGTDPVKGINAKLAGLTLETLGAGEGVMSIMTGLTMGDLVDSGILTLTEQNEYKLDIMYDLSGQCNIGEYLVNKFSMTAKAYYESKHGTDQTYRGYWKAQKIGDVLNEMLSSL